MPDLFIGEKAKIPKAIQKTWRKALDTSIENNKDGAIHYLYNEKNYSNITLIFATHDKLSAKRFLQNASQTLKTLFEKQQREGEEAIFDTNADDQKHKVGSSDRALSNVIKQGLNETSSIKEFDFWAARALQEVRLHTDKKSFPPTLQKQAKLLTVGFLPLWKAGSEALIGAFTTAFSAHKITGNSRTLQSDLANLTIACTEALRLTANKTQALIIIPISFNSFKHKSFYDLYVATLRKIDPDIHKYLVFEFRDTPSTLTEPIKALVSEIKLLSRGYMINMNILSPPRIRGFDQSFPHAYGLDLSAALNNFSIEDINKRLQKFANFYKGHKAIMFAKGIPNAAIAKKCKDLGFTYLSGSALTKPNRQCGVITKITLEALLEKNKK